MKLNRIELKKVIYDFNSVSNRFLRADYNDFSSILSKFLSHLSSVGIIADYIQDCGQPTYDVKTEVEEVMKSHGSAIFELGDTEQHEVANIYHIIKYCVDNNICIPRTVARGYSSSNKYQDMTKEFNERVSMVLIRHIEGYLTKIGIDMGMDENIKYSITVNHGQVNLASDNATINATQNIGIDIETLNTLLNAVREQITPETPEDDEQMILDNLEVVENQLSQPNPRKGFLRTAISGLKAIKGTAEFSAAVIALAQFVSVYL